MLSYTKLAGNARRFKTLMGMSLQEFDLLFAKVEKAHPGAERERLSKRPRRRAIGAGRRFALDLRNRVLLLPFYYRTYTASNMFEIGPAKTRWIPSPYQLHEKRRTVTAVPGREGSKRQGQADADN